MVTSGGEIRNFMTLEPIDSTCDGPSSWQALVQVPTRSLFGSFRGFSSSWDDWCGLLARVDHLIGWSIGLHQVWWLVWRLVASPSAEPDELLISNEGVSSISLNPVPSVIVLVNDATVGVPQFSDGILYNNSLIELEWAARELGTVFLDLLSI